ncbi:MAG: hypothetical protein EPN38_01935 [Rhodanobacteraceae bacterium]|nr:MAG: hypothetical protein EPN38_01935 [Rhodanobacteraceae bacterium]
MIDPGFSQLPLWATNALIASGPEKRSKAARRLPCHGIPCPFRLIVACTAGFGLVGGKTGVVLTPVARR